MDSKGLGQIFLANFLHYESEDYFSLFVELGLIVLLLFISAAVSGSEVAFFSLRSEDLVDCKDSEKKSDRTIAALLESPRKLLATILILNNFVNIAIVTSFVFLTWQIFGKEHQGLLTVSVTVIVTFLIVFFGEILPKVFANQNNLSFARKTAFLLNTSAIVLTPLSFLLTKSSVFLEKRIKKKGYDVSVEEIRQALELASVTSTEEERDILRGIVTFGTINVKQIMRSRIDITAFDHSIDFHQLMDKINKCSYSRIPVYLERIDNIKGILYIKDILPFLDQNENFAWQKLLRPCFFIPETKKIDDLLKNFQQRRVHLAVVVDEYGGTSGLVTLEDIIEEIVGEITDEFDKEDINYSKIDKHTYVFEGKVSLNDFLKIVERNLVEFDEVKGESESLGGLLLELHKKMPQVGEHITHEDFEFVIESVTSKKIKRIRVFINESKEDNIDN